MPTLEETLRRGWFSRLMERASDAYSERRAKQVAGERAEDRREALHAEASTRPLTGLR